MPNARGIVLRRLRRTAVQRQLRRPRLRQRPPWVPLLLALGPFARCTCRARARPGQSRSQRVRSTTTWRIRRLWAGRGQAAGIGPGCVASGPAVREPAQRRVLGRIGKVERAQQVDLEIAQLAAHVQQTPRRRGLQGSIDDSLSRSGAPNSEAVAAIQRVPVAAPGCGLVQLIVVEAPATEHLLCSRG
jgi:hypothetical protein